MVVRIEKSSGGRTVSNADRLSSTLEKIALSGASASEKQKALATAQNKKKPNIALRVVGRALDIVDTPRAFVAAGLSEGTDALTDLFKLDGHETLNASWKDFWDATWSNKGFGKHFQEKMDAENLAREKRGDKPKKTFGVISDDNKWAKRGIGLLGDIAADPLTYLAPEATLAKVGGQKAVARALFSQADDVAAHKLAQKIARDGMTSLSKGELNTVNQVLQKTGKLGTDEAIRGGMHWTVPGTGRVASKVTRSTAGPKQVQVVPQSLARVTPKGVFEATRKTVRNTFSGTRVADLVAGQDAIVKRMVFTGSPDQARQAFLALDTARSKRLLTRRMLQELENSWAGLEHDAKKLGVDGTEVYRAMGMDDAAIAELPDAMQQFVKRAREFSEEARLYANEVAGEQWLVKREQWQPALASEDFKEILKESGRSPRMAGKSFKPSGIEKRAKLVAGEEFLGETLLDASEYQKLHGVALDPRGQAEKILQDRMQRMGAEHVYAMFEDDVFKAMPAYIRDLGYRTTYRSIEADLAKKGIALDMYRTVFDDKAVEAAKRRSKAMGVWYDARQKVKSQAAVAESARKRADAAKATEDAYALEIAKIKEKAFLDADLADARLAAQEGHTARLRAAGGGLEREAAEASQRASQALSELDVMNANFTERLEEAVNAVAESNKALGKVQRQLNYLTQERDRVRAGIVKVYERADERVAKELTRRKELASLENYLAEIEDRIAGLHAQIVNGGVRPGIGDEITAIKDKLHQLVTDPNNKKRFDLLRMAVEAADSHDVAKIRGLDIRDVRKILEGLGVRDIPQARKLLASRDRMVDALKQQLLNLQTEQKVFDQTTRYVVGAEMDYWRQGLTQVRQQIEAVAASNDPLAAQAAEVLERMSTVSEKGTLINAVNGDDIWFQGVRGTQLDLTRQVNDVIQGGGLEAGFPGLPFFANDGFDDIARDIFEMPGPKPKVASVKLRVANPRVYGPDVATLGKVADMDPQWNHLVYGNAAPAGLRQAQADMLRNAFAMGAIDINDLKPVTQEGLDVVDGWWDDFVGDVDALMEHGYDAESAITSALSVSHFDDYIDRLGGQPQLRELGEQVTSEEYLFNKFIYEVGGHADDSVKRRIGLAFADKLEAEGFDGFQYANRSGDYVTMPLHPSQVEAAVDAGYALVGQKVDDAIQYLDMGEGILPADHVRLYSTDGVNWTMDRAAAQAAAGEGDLLYRNVPTNQAQPTMVGEVPNAAKVDPANPQLQVARQELLELQADMDRYGQELVRNYSQLMGDIKDRMTEGAKYAKQLEQELGAKVSQHTVTLQDAVAAHRANRARLRSVERELADTRKKLRADHRAARIEEFDLRQRADDIFTKADEYERRTRTAYEQQMEAIGNEMAQALEFPMVMQEQAIAQSLRLQAQAAKAEADLARAGKRALKAEAAVAKLKDPGTLTKIEQVVMPAGYAKMGWSRMAPEWIVEGLAEGTKFMGPDALRGVIRAYDKFTNLWKAYAMLTPGFHFRNTFGGFFNNWTDGIDMGRYREYLSLAKPYNRARRSGMEHADALLALKKAHPNDPEGVRIFTEIIESGILTGGQSREMIIHTALGGNWKPWSADNKLLQASTAGITGPGGRHLPGTENVENFLRGAVAIDTMRKGGDLNAAIDRVYKLHFDYDDLSQFERGVMRRIIPFYTWTRKNMPLQIEQFLTNPKAYTRLMAIERNIELGVEEEEVVPSWFEDNLVTIHTPWKLGKGENKADVYLMPDLPYKDITRTLSPRQIMSMTNPIIKTPLELWAGKQFFSDIPFKGTYQAAPESWNKMGVTDALGAIGKAKQGADGKWMMTDRTAYVVEQFLPLMGRARRALPSEDKYKDRQMTSMMSMLFGVGARTNTTADKEGELYRRNKELEQQAKLLESLGYIEKKSSSTKKTVRPVNFSPS